jgi:hypothetical protein
MAPSPEKRPPMAVALEWVSRITAVALAMVLPGLFGYWLDIKLGTSFLAPTGFVLGIVGGMWSLMALTGVVKSNRRGIDPARDENDR